MPLSWIKNSNVNAGEAFEVADPTGITSLGPLLQQAVGQGFITSPNRSQGLTLTFTLLRAVRRIKFGNSVHANAPAVSVEALPGIEIVPHAPNLVL